MKCDACKKENTEGVKFCKYCGSPIGIDFKTCSNGHNYEVSLGSCPYCPAEELEATRLDSPDDAGTVLDDPLKSDKTIIDTSKPTLNPQSNSNLDKTIIFKPDEKPNEGASNEFNYSTGRKLVGWLVTYNIDPNGTDYRIFEGRAKIGRSNRNDIILNQPGVSDEHAIILYRNNKFIIEDKLSTNGTFINGVSIDEKVILKNDDVIKIGDVELLLKII